MVWKDRVQKWLCLFCLSVLVSGLLAWVEPPFWGIAARSVSSTIASQQGRAVAPAPLTSIHAQSQESAPLKGFPPLQVHPLPASLAQWQDPNNAGDYFHRVKPTKLGYLVWSEFPLKVYIDQATDSASETAALNRLRGWSDAVLQAVQEWGNYLPLVVVERPDQAQISILAETPPLRRLAPAATKPSPPGNPRLQLPRARSAETRYEFYLQQADGQPPRLSHRCKISLKPGQPQKYIHAAARHELGHALGIWGHSDRKTDVLYFSQVRNPPSISVRDINTLKRVYEQPTRLGWPLPR